MTAHSPHFQVRLARSETDVQAAQHLRYRVFVQEMHGDGDGVDHARQLETDRYDPFCDHMLLLDEARGDTVSEQTVGVYRLMRSEQADRAGGFYSAGEYDLSRLLSSDRRLLELGRSCLLPEYRGGAALFHLWSGLAHFATEFHSEVLFGSASFHGTDIKALAEPLSFLHHGHLAPPDLRVSSLPEHFQPMDIIPDDALDRVKASRAVPALIKAYLRLGGFVGEGAFVDHAFNTTDVCLILDVARMSERQKTQFQRKVT